MSDYTTPNLTLEEREIVDFFKGLIPILEDAFLDLERRNLLDKEFFVTKKNS